jgi:GH24 family phage-related lysozyme (muramidase)
VFEGREEIDPTSTTSELPDLVNTKGTETLFGEDAVAKVTEIEGELTPIQERIVREEAYVNGFYKDDVGVKTGGVGQTGKFLKQTFKETFEAKEKVARKLFSSYDNLSEEVRGAVMSAVYRGDAKSSNKWVKLVNEGRFDEAGDEFLNNAEYKKRKAKGNDGVVKRMEDISAILKGQE